MFAHAWNDTISYVQLGWNSYGSCVSGPFKDAANKFMGVRFHLDDTNSMYYGWVRLDVSDFKQVIVKDYAYEQTANKMIYAGSNVSVSDRNGILNVENVKVFSSGRNVIINAAGDFRAEAEIINTLGQRVKHIQVREGRTEIPVNRSGIYFIRLRVDDAMITRKVLIQ
jgi:hypothetical protein